MIKNRWIMKCRSPCEEVCGIQYIPDKPAQTERRSGT